MVILSKQVALAAVLFFVQCKVGSATTTGEISSIGPSSISVSTATLVTLQGSAATDKYDWSAAGASDCSGVTPSTAISGTDETIFVNLGSTGTYKLCYDASGAGDSVAQANGDLTVIAATGATAVTLGTTSITISFATSIALTGSASGDKFSWSAVGASDCTLVTPSTLINSPNEVVSVNLGTQGTYKLCYRASGGSDSVVQTNGVLAVVYATLASEITISPTTIAANSPTPVTFTGSGANDYFSWSAAGAADCTGVTPLTAIGSTDEAPTVTLSGAGTYRLCYRNAGGSDTVMQTNGDLVVSAPASAGGDPVASFGDIKRYFELPPGVLVPLLRAPDFVLLGETFEGSGPWEQWFKRMVIRSKDGKHFVQVAIKSGLEQFNRSRVPRDAFQTLDVTVGTGDISSPRAVEQLHSLGAQVDPLFLGAHIVFQPVKRSHIQQSATIGQARRECMEWLSWTMHLYICSAAADEYYGDQRHLAIRYAHVDFLVFKSSDFSNIEGLFPELWGLKPLSKENAAYVKDAAKPAPHAAPVPDDSESKLADQVSDGVPNTTCASITGSWKEAAGACIAAEANKAAVPLAV